MSRRQWDERVTRRTRGQNQSPWFSARYYAPDPGRMPLEKLSHAELTRRHEQRLREADMRLEYGEITPSAHRRIVGLLSELHARLATVAGEDNAFANWV